MDTVAGAACLLCTAGDGSLRIALRTPIFPLFARRRGATGSDEYVELYNAGDGPVELGGLELVYVTASGGTATRKHAWSDRRMPPGGRVLLANADGTFASIADHTYTGGFAAGGGSLVALLLLPHAAAAITITPAHRPETKRFMSDVARARNPRLLG